MVEFISCKEKLPDDECDVEVLRDFGCVVRNPSHHAYGCRFGIERTRYKTSFKFGAGLFVCDMVSTGNVTHWRKAESLEIDNSCQDFMNDLDSE